MSNLNVIINAKSNVTGAQAGIEKLHAQNELLNASLQRTLKLNQAITTQSASTYRDLGGLMARNSSSFRNAAASTGMFEAAQLRLNNATDDYVKKLQKQKVGLRDFLRARRGMLSDAARAEQIAMESMMVRRTGTTQAGQGIYDVVHPSQIHKDMDTTSRKLAFMREELKSVATQTVNWGKNMQWAGRQLMVGFTIPLAAFGAAAGVMAFQVDKQLTRIQKVYDTTANQANTSAQSQMAVQKELNQVRVESLANAKQAAGDYGASVKDTLEVEADLAATGLKGSELRSATTEVVKNATLGEIEYQDALQATIAMQSALRLNTQETGDAWAYMNSVENATSLSMKDFAAALPVAAGPIRQMGGDIKLLGQYLVSMRERGIEARQGANAIKAMMSRLFRPSKQVREEWEALAKVDLGAMVERNKGNVEGMMNDIAKATENLNRQDTTKLLAGLFGTWQVGRMNAIIEGIRDVNEGIGQTTDAYNIANQSAEKWRSVQEYELEQFRKSLSGKFKIALESFKGELVTVGTVFLEAGTIILKVVTKLVNAFNSLPDAVKKSAAIAAILVALVGPAVMLVGLFGNLAGNIAKFLITMSGLGNRMTLFSREEKAAALATEMVNNQLLEQGTAARLAAAQVDKLRQSMVMANHEMGVYSKFRAPTGLGAVGATGMPGRYQDSSGNWHWSQSSQGPLGPGATGHKGGSYASGPKGYSMVTPSAPIIPALPGKYDASALPDMERSTAKIAENQKKNAAFAARAALGMAAFGVAATVAATSTNETVQQLSQAVMLATLIGPAVMAVGRYLATALPGIMATMGAQFAAMRVGMASLVAGPGVIGAGIASLLGPVGMFTAALAAAGAAAYVIYKHLVKSREEAEKNYASAESLAKIYGFTETEAPASLNRSGESTTTQVDRAKELRKEYGALIENIKRARDEEEALNNAMVIGTKVIAAGGTGDQARQAVTDALIAAGKTAKQAKAITLRFKGRLDFEDPDVLRKAAIAAAEAQLNDAVIKAKGIQPDVAKVIGESAGKAYSQAFDSALQTGKFDSQKQAIESLQQGLAKYNQSIRDAGRAENAPQGFALIEAREKFIKSFIKAQGIEGDQAEMLYKQYLATKNVYKSILDSAINLNPETRQWLETQIATTKAARAGVNILQVQRQAAHGVVEDTGDIRDRTGEAAKQASKVKDNMKATKEETKGVKDAAATVTSELKKWSANPWQEVASGFKDAMTSTQDQIAEIASENFDNRMTSAMDSVRAAGQRRLDALSAAQQRMSDALNNRHQRQSDRLSSAQEAEDRRLSNAQEAATRRLNNVQEAATRRLGAVQEAASRRLDNMQDAASRRLDDAQERASRKLSDAQEEASRRLDEQWERRTFRAEKRWDAREKAIENAYDARIEGIEKAIEAEQKAEEMRQKIFEAEMTRIQRLTDIANKNIDFNVALNTGNLDEAAKIRNDIQAQQAEWRLQDAADEGGTESEKKIKRLEARKDTIETMKDKRLEALADEREAFFRHLKKMEEREKRSLEKRQRAVQRALEKRQEAESRALEKMQQKVQRALEKRQQAEQRALEKRQRIEQRYLEKRQQTEQRYLDKRQKAEQRSLEKRQAVESKAMERQHKRRQKLLQREVDNNVEAQQRIWENRRKNLDRAIEAFRAYVPKNERDLKQHVARISQRYQDFNVATRGKFNKTAVNIHNFLLQNMRRVVREMQSEIDWATGGAKIADRMARGMFGLDRQGMFRWLTTGQFPGKKKPPSIKSLQKKFAARNRGGPDTNYHQRGGPIDSTAHEGGYLGGKSLPQSRKGVARTAKSHNSELMVRAQKGEYVMQRKAVDRYGIDVMDRMNDGKLIDNGVRNKQTKKPLPRTGGAGDMGMAGLASVVIGAMMQQALETAMVNSAISMIESSMMGMSGTFGSVKSGSYSGISLSAEQIRNARTIANVGSSLGATKRDIVIALMTAMQESTLRNLSYGDRDSVGLFQQRAPWGSFAQRTDPATAAKMFFKGGSAAPDGYSEPGLFDYPNRNSLSMTQAAQQVQVSAYPSAYAKWQGMATALVQAMSKTGGPSTSGSVIAGPGGRHRPVRGGHQTQGLHDTNTSYPAVDIGVPVGSPVYAVATGRIIDSYDLRGNDGRVSNGGYYSYGRVIKQAVPGGSVLYAHLNQRYAQKGQMVTGGSVIGKSGNTGHSFGPHLHFGARGVSPYAFLKTGGFVMSDGLANLHEGESVMTKPLTEQLVKGVEVLASGGTNNYNVNMVFSGDVNDKASLRRFIVDTFKSLDRGPDSRKGSD